MTTYLLEPVLSYPMGTGYPSLWRHYHLDKGATLIKEAGVWSLATSPGTDRLNAAQSYYRGGYQNVVDAAVAAELVADGFGSFLTAIGGGGLVDDFDGVALGDWWTSVGVNPLPTVADGCAVFDGAEPWARTVDSFDVTGSFAVFKISGAYTGAAFGFLDADDVGVVVAQLASGFWILAPASDPPGAYTLGAVVEGDEWFRLTESGGVVTLASSPDGVTWADLGVTEVEVIGLDAPVTGVISGIDWLCDRVEIPAYPEVVV